MSLGARLQEPSEAVSGEPASSASTELRAHMDAIELYLPPLSSWLLNDTYATAARANDLCRSAVVNRGL